MKLGHRILLVGLTLPFVAVGAMLVYWICSASAAKLQEGAFEAIAENSPRSSVVASLGTPDVVRPCGDNLWWGGDGQDRGANDGRCVTEERYEYFLTAYGIGYSSEGQVVSKYRYVSE